MKAIETIYNGYRFRSRLEARWAVFFDVLGVEYVYEPEGFDLGNDEWYLPDFYLPQFNVYAEIKPSIVENVEQYRNKCERFRDEIGHAIVLCFGSPFKATYMHIWGFEIDKEDLDGGFYDTDALFVFHNNEILLALKYVGDTFCVTDTMTESSRITSESRIFNMAQEQWFAIEFGLSEKPPILAEAATAAKQARFEHGEKGR